MLEAPLVLHTAEGILVFPAGVQVDVTSNDDWYHDMQDADLIEALELLENA